jgi:hypothetical protein
MWVGTGECRVAQALYARSCLGYIVKSGSRLPPNLKHPTLTTGIWINNFNMKQIVRDAVREFYDVLWILLGERFRKG